MLSNIILMLALCSKDRGGPYFPPLSFEPPTKMDRFVDWVIRISIGVGVAVTAFGLLWALFLIGLAIYVLFA